MLQGVGDTTAGQAGRWQAVAPAGLELVGATVTGVFPSGVNTGHGYGGGFYWAGGGASVNTSTPSTVGMVFAAPSSYFGMQVICGWSKCSEPRSFVEFAAQGFSLYVRETVGPSFVAPTGLWSASGWVRGTWPLVAWGTRPQGCARSRPG